MDLIVCVYHAHVLFAQYAEDVYFKLEEACRGSKYADSLKPFCKKKDGCGTFIALKAQYTGKDKWDAEIKHYVTLIHTFKWKGNSSHTLDLCVS